MNKKDILNRILVTEVTRMGGTLLIDPQAWTNYMRDSGMSTYDQFFNNFSNIHHEDLGNYKYKLKLKPDFTVCQAYNHDGCEEPSCNNLHFCLHFLYEECKFKGKCRCSHEFYDSHNILILKRNFMDKLDAEQLTKILLKLNLEGLALICRGYNSFGCKFGPKCKSLHLCNFYINGSCNFGKNCKRSHNLCDVTVTTILSTRGYNVSQKPGDLLKDIRETLNIEVKSSRERSTSSNQSHAIKSALKHEKQDLKDARETFNIEVKSSRERSTSGNQSHAIEGASKHEKQDLEDDTPQICTYYLRNKCLYNKSCTKFHQPDHLPYHWQYQNAEGSWNDLPQNKVIERSYCNCEDQLNLELKTKMVVVLLLNQMKLNSGEKVRRLSTEPQRVVSDELQYLTLWKWFWCEDDRRMSWNYYQEQDSYPSSEMIESAFKKDNKMIYQFETKSWKYAIDFKNMVQINEITRKTRKVNRRPDIFDEMTKMPRSISNQVTKKNVKAITIPEYWSGLMMDDNKSYHLVDVPAFGVTAEEFSRVNKMFKKTANRDISKLTRIENLELWRFFSVKLDSLHSKCERRSTVKYLFHGTHSQYLEAIMQQGFDFRLSGIRSGTKYGKGSYFARDALYSMNYSDCNKMFLAKVIIGEFVKGDPSFTRPPLRLGLKSDTYESCVNSQSDPSIFVIFDNCQSYAEYLIEY